MLEPQCKVILYFRFKLYVLLVRYVYDMVTGWQRLTAQTVVLSYSLRAYCEL